MQTALEKIVPSNAFWDQSSMFLKSLLVLLRSWYEITSTTESNPYRLGS